MPNQARTVEGFSYEDISDPSQVPDTDLNDRPDALYVPLGRVFPAVALERISMADLLEHFAEHLPFTGELEQAARDRQALSMRITEGVTERAALDTHIETNSHNIGLLSDRIAALEQAGTMQPHASAGQLLYGTRNNAGALVGTRQMVNYASLPSTVALTFPAGTATDDVWFVTFPTGAVAQHIWSTAVGRIDETDSWEYDETTRTYTFSGGLTPGFPGNYEIAVIAG